MRFRLIEKDTVGTGTEFMQDTEEDGNTGHVTTSHSKTYIGSNSKKKVDMNKIKNTKIGDDIHYYINGVEGRGIVVKMANEYLEVFKENGQLGTIHINDTFFVKDILINKTWDDMDNQERYEALVKIHAPTPRFIMKSWYDIPEEIKALLTKEGGNMAGGTGSTMEEGESKDSETKDHARTGFAQNTQYAKKGLCEIHKTENCPHCGNAQPEKKKAPKVKKQRWIDPTTGEEDKSEHSYRYEREQATEKHKDTMKPEEHEGHPDYFSKEKNPFWNKRVATDPNRLATDGKPYGKGHYQTYHPDDPVSDHTRRKGHKDNYVRTGGESPQRARRRNRQNVHTGEADYEAKHQAYKNRRDSYDKAKKVVTDAEQPNVKAGNKPKETLAEIYQYKQPSSGHSIQDKWDKEAEKKPATDKEQDEGLKDLGLKKSVYEQWLEKKHTQYHHMGEPDPKNPKKTVSAHGPADRDPRRKKPRHEPDQPRHEPDYPRNPEGEERRGAAEDHKYKSDVEHGRYGNAAGTPEVGVSTDTKVDVAEDTGYEERPHISVEEAGKLPRTTFNPHGSDELHVSGDARKTGLPQQHPNTYGMRYGMKGGVKKVWCPEHQMWEETRKDWHEDK